MSEGMQPDESVRKKEKVIVSASNYLGDPNVLYGEKYGVDWEYGLTFSRVVDEATLHGHAIARAGWNGKDQFVYYVPPASYPAQTGVAEAIFGGGAPVPYEGYYAIKNAQGRVAVWVPSTGDLQADDWYVITQDDLFLKYHPRPKKTGGLNFIGDPNMPLYIGTKTVAAFPMTRGEYNAYRGWELPADEDGSDPGYLVEYTDGGKANHKNHAGYISWSPKDVFDRTYKKVD